MAQVLLPNNWNDNTVPLGQEARQALSQFRQAVSSVDKINTTMTQIATDAELAAKYGITEAEATTLRAVWGSANGEIAGGAFIQQLLANYN